ncbi:YadA-like family protein [Moraxella nonliquefaciens]|uniref:YadA-like family protein n=1 Tax=Moraxella nonliquefaciens TaxID=478 RepID=UPI0024A667E6|nr:YadA-like family protein [Moraxella nonliquefaciens]
MNHIYKVIFNKATGTFMAVAEYAKSHSGGGVSSSTTGQVGNSSVICLTRVATLAILAIAAMFNVSAYAAEGSVALGQMTGRGDQYSTGKNAAAEGGYSIAVGEYSTAKGDQSIAIGGGQGKGSASNALTVGATALGKESVAIGGDVTAKGHASVAIGSDDLYLGETQGNTIDLINEHPELKRIKDAPATINNAANPNKYERTTASGHASVSVGTMSKALGDFANAFGTRAVADGAFSVAVGLTSKATGKSSLALGSASKAKADQTIAIGSQTEAEGIGAIAIGADGKDITKISTKSSTVGKGQSAVSKTNKEHYKDIAGGYLENTNSLANFATAKTKSEDGAIAIGSQAYGEGVWSNAFGVRARSEGFASTAVGTGSHAQGKGSVAIGAGANATENWSVAIGAGSIAQGTGAFPNATTKAYDPSNTLTADQKGTDKYGVVSVGRDKTNDVVRRRITNVGAGASDTDAVNVAQLKAVEEIAKKAGGGGGTTTTVRADDGETHITVTQNTNGNSNEYKLKLDDNAKNAINKVNQITANVSDINKVNDGIGFTADVASNNGSSVKVTRKLGENIDIKGGKSSINDLTDNNIGVVANGTNLNIKLAKELNGLTKVAVTGNNNTNAELLNGGLTFTQTGANAGKTVYGTDGLKFTNANNSAKHQSVRITNEKIGFSGTDGTVANNLPYMHKDGINMTSKKITSLANGTADTDAVTIKQLKDAKPNITAGTGINITNGNNGNLVDTNTGNVAIPTYTIGVKTTELSSNGNGANKFSVSDTNNNSALVTADKLKDYLNQVNQTADTASQTANNAKQEATTAKSTAEAAKSTANTATSTANQAQQSAQTAQQNAQKSASEAQTAKTAAQNSATQAQTAQQQATQANQSAQQAKQQAATSAQQAQQAKTAAESAKSDATNAKTAAEAAKAAASNVKYKTSSSGTAQSLNVSDSKPLTFEQGDNITLEKSSDGTLKISSTASSNYKAWKLNTENGIAETINNNDEVKFIGKKTTTGNQSPHQNIKITQNTANKKELEFALNDELKLNPSTGYLSVGNTTLNNGGLTVYKSDFTEQLQLGADGIKFADKSGNAAIGVTKENSTRITSSGVGFSKVDGALDEAQPHIKASGINAGNQAISNVKEATQDTDAVNKGQVNKLIQEKIKPVELTVNDNTNNQSSRFDVKDTDKDGFVTADKLKEYLNKVDQSADIAKTNAESANQQAAAAKSESEKAKNEAADAKTTANDNKTKLDNLGDTSQLKQNVDKALQTFKVQKDGDDTNTITVGKNSTTSNDTVNTLKLKGENGLDVKTNKNGTVTFGVDTTKGLTTPKLTVSSNNGNGIVIDSQNGQNTITGLSSTLSSITNTGNAHTTAQGNTITNDKDKSNAASIADVLNAGFNLQGNGTAVDFVSTYDTVNFTNGNATTAKVTYDGDKQTSTVTYDVNVDNKTINLTGANSSKQLSVKTTTLTKTNGTANTNFSAGNNGDALVKAKDIASNLNDLAKEISTAKGTVGNALQSLTVKGGNDENTNNGIMLSKNSTELTLAGDNGVTVKTDAAKKKVTVGIDTTGGLKVGNSTLNNGGLTVKNGNEQIQVGADGVKFADVNGGTVGAPKVGTTRITKDDIGFAGADGAIDKQLPYLDKKQLKIGQVEITKDSGINAGNQEITNVKSAIADTTNGQANQSFVTRLETAGKDTNKQNSAATVKDLYDLSQSPLTFAGDTGGNVAKKLGETLNIKGGENTENKLTNGNIGVVADSTNGLTVKLAKTLNNLEAVNTKTLTATEKVKVGNGTTNTAELLSGGLTFTPTTGTNTGKTVYGVDGLKFTNNNNAPLIGTTRITSDHIGFAKEDGTLDAQAPHLDKNRLKVGAVEITKDSGINAGNQKITNIADGKNDTDAVSYKQHKQVADKLDGLDKNALDQVKTALQTFKVQNGDDETNAITVGKDTNGDKVNTLKFKGENGVDVKTKKDGTVTFGIDQSKGLTTPKLTVGSNTDGNGNKVSIDKDNGIHFLTKDGNKDTNAPAITKDGINTGGKAITGLSNTLTDATNPNTGHVSEIKGLAQDADKTRAASIGDVLNAGFNLQGNGTAVDFVSTYDTVNFTNGNATTAKVAYDEASKTNTVTYDVNVDNTTLTLIDGQNGKKQIGVKTTTLTSNGTGTNKFALSNQGTGSDNGDALIKAKDIVTHLNTLAGDIQTAKGASQAGNSAGYVDADGNKVIYDSTDNKYYQANGNSNTKVEVAKDKLVAQAQTPDGTLAQMNVKSVITKERENTANGINEDNAFVKGLEKAASNNKTKNAAVTVNDLHQVASTPITFKSDDGVHSQVNLGDTFAMTGGADYKNLSDGKNIGVVSQPDGVQFKLAKDLKDLNSVSAGGTKIDEKGVSFVDSSGQAKANTPVLSANGLDMGGKVISNVGKGTKDTDAANMQQLNEVRSLLGLGNASNGNAGSGNTGNSGGGQVNIADIKKDPNSGSGSSSNSPAIKAGTVLGGKGNNNADKLESGGVQVGVDKEGRANGDLNNVWVKTQEDGSKKALLTTYNVQDQTNYVTNNPAEAIDRMNEQGIRFFHVNDGNQEPVVQGRNSIDSSASGRHSAAVGYQAKASGDAAVAVGRQTQAGNQSIAIGDKAQATGNQSIAIGTGNVVTGKHSGAIGDPSTVKADNSYSVGNNNQFTDATQTDVFGVGNNITVTESNSVALGSNSAISAGKEAGTQAKKSDGTAGKTTTAGATGTVKGFAGQTAVGAVSVGASGAERRIQNVAAGEVSATSTDAVNGSQLYKATQGIANATNELGHRIHQNENKANAGISSAMAMASMPQAYIPGRSMVTGGIATYNGQGAVAVGLSKLSDNGQWIFKINGSADTQGNAGAAVGAGFHW